MRESKKVYHMKHWKIISQGSENDKKGTVEDIVSVLLLNRDLRKKDDIEKFLNQNIEDVSLESSDINTAEFKKFKKRIDEAIEKKEKIVIFGDYDVDGICATAILWETLYTKTKHVIPYIPDRVDEGYGLSKKGIDNILKSHSDIKIIVTVDNGIVAHDAVNYANEKGIDVIITDHHVKGKRLPTAFCILHTTSLCGAGIAWVIAKELAFEREEKVIEKLDLATLATIADLVPLRDNNRAIVKRGLEILKQTKRLGLKELLKAAGIDKDTIGVYAIGHVIAPRLNATGRIQSAMNALRLLCTNNLSRAMELAAMLGSVNRDRQGMTEQAVAHAKLLAIESIYGPKITLVAHSSYNQGIIGLVASQLVESYWRPAFAISIGEKVSKGSARSIAGVNIIELIRSVSHTIIEAGGHPMAAGFSVETERIDEFAKALSEKADEVITDELLKRYITIDMFLSFEMVGKDLVKAISSLEPFGIGNPEPVFATKGVTVVEVRKIGRDQNHLKMKVEKNGKVFDAVAFGYAGKVDVLAGDAIDLAYTVDENEWNGKKSMQLKIKDLKNPDSQ
jgi:single-stranded-DNA-specific exonuclease